MEDLNKITTTTVTVFTRHSADCKKTDPQWKRCNCRKSLYIYADGKVTYKSAKTRSWETAEKAAQAERDARDPVLLRLKEINDDVSAKTAGAITVETATHRWLKGFKVQPSSTAKAYRGMIGDVLKLARTHLIGNRLVLTTQKTKADFDRVMPDDVAEALRSLPPQPHAHPDYFFWSRTCSHLSLTSRWTKRVKMLRPHLHFVDDHGKPLEFHSQMLRDTFAVDMLLAGMPLEDVSRLLTHKSVRTTEKYYARWVKAREKKLEEKMVEAMRRMGAKVSF